MFPCKCTLNYFRKKIISITLVPSASLLICVGLFVCWGVYVVTGCAQALCRCRVEQCVHAGFFLEGAGVPVAVCLVTCLAKELCGQHAPEQNHRQTCVKTLHSHNVVAHGKITDSYFSKCT